MSEVPLDQNAPPCYLTIEHGVDIKKSSIMTDEGHGKGTNMEPSHHSAPSSGYASFSSSSDSVCSSLEDDNLTDAKHNDYFAWVDGIARELSPNNIGNHGDSKESCSQVKPEQTKTCPDAKKQMLSSENEKYIPEQIEISKVVQIETNEKTSCEGCGTDSKAEDDIKLGKCLEADIKVVAQTCVVPEEKYDASGTPDHDAGEEIKQCEEMTDRLSNDEGNHSEDENESETDESCNYSDLESQCSQESDCPDYSDNEGEKENQTLGMEMEMEVIHELFEETKEAEENGRTSPPPVPARNIMTYPSRSFFVKQSGVIESIQRSPSVSGDEDEKNSDSEWDLNLFEGGDEIACGRPQCIHPNGYAFPKVQPNNIKQVISFWELDFQVGLYMVTRMGAWEQTAAAPSRAKSPSDSRKYLAYKSLYCRWLECNKSEDQWRSRYWGRSLVDIVNGKIGREKMTSLSCGVVSGGVADPLSDSSYLRSFWCS